MKSDKFFKRSREISDDFIQNVIFIDDEAFNTNANSGNDLDPLAITHSFAKFRKICAVYNPKEESEIENLSFIAKKADIAVLDWRINLKDKPIQPENEEEDEDNVDPRGQHTIKILKEVLSIGKVGHDGLKLVIIYTGEIDLAAIATEIYDSLDNAIYTKDNDFKISSDYTKILIVGKPTLQNQIKHYPELKDRIISYESLPEFITQEFTKMTSGLVSNMALNAISVLRKSTSKILKIYNKNIDPAYLSHRALLPTPEDAGELLKDTLLSSFSSILDYNKIVENCDFPQIRDWIQQNNFSEKQLDVKKQNTIKISSNELKNWQLRGYILSVKEALIKQHPNVQINDNNLEAAYKSLKDALIYFTPDNYVGKDANEKFSMLTHHKSNYAEALYKPRLTLGTVVKGTTSGNYWVCIQQKCDSVRITAQESRKFLFLPLDNIIGNKNFHFLALSEGLPVKLKVDYRTHKIRTIKFTANHNQMVYARRFGKSIRYLFKPFYSKGHAKFDKVSDEMFEWIFDLKESHAQKVANHYSSQLSRVGVDESEWLRRS